MKGILLENALDGEYMPSAVIAGTRMTTMETATTVRGRETETGTLGYGEEDPKVPKKSKDSS